MKERLKCCAVEAVNPAGMQPLHPANPGAPLSPEYFQDGTSPSIRLFSEGIELEQVMPVNAGDTESQMAKAGRDHSGTSAPTSLPQAGF